MPLTVPVECIHPRYRCCGCLHVRTGTFLLAVFQIIIHFVVIAISTATIRQTMNPLTDSDRHSCILSVMSFIQWERLVTESDKVLYPSNSKIDINATKLPGPSPKTIRSHFYLRATKFMNAGEEYISIAITLFSLLCSIVLLVGVVYGRPYNLLPYCCLQCLDFFITCLSVVGYYTCLPDGNWSRTKIALSIFVILAGISLLSIKAYLLRMVWLCYKFLIRYAAGLEHVTGFAFAAGSCLIPLPFCQQSLLTRDRPNSVNPFRPFMTSSQGQSSCETSPDQDSFIYFLRNLASEPVHQQSYAPPTRTTAIHPILEDSLPPKYEDVVSGPPTTFDPPPYSSEFSITLDGDVLTSPPTDTNRTSRPEMVNSSSSFTTSTTPR